MPAELKQVIIVRDDLKLTKGKMAAQVSHASVGAVLKTHKDDLKSWQDQGMKKVVLKVPNLDTLLKYMRKAQDAGLVGSLITDAGGKQFLRGPTTRSFIFSGAKKKKKKRKEVV